MKQPIVEPRDQNIGAGRFRVEAHRRDRVTFREAEQDSLFRWCELAMSRHGGGDAGLLFQHDGRDGIDRGLAVFGRDIQVSVPRRHAVVKR